MSNRDHEDLEEFELPSRDDRDDLDDDLEELHLGDDADDEDDDGDDDADDDDDDADDDDDDDFDDVEDATADEIDLVVGIYREDGLPVATALALDLANDLDELIGQLRRQPADAGAIGMVSLVGEVFVIVRVRGANVQVLVSDASAAGDWPIARDVADFLGVEEIPDPEDESEPLGDLGLLSDLGVSEFEMEAFTEDYDSDSDELLAEIAEKIKVGPAFRRAAESFDSESFD